MGTNGHEATLGEQKGEVSRSKFSSQRHSKNLKYDDGNGLRSRIAAGRYFVESNSKFCQWQFTL
ncbi:hypothetical protein SLS53_007608 [Cytospora paraplurivora]|uniref:Uncharacterized protein n=1 Tax=Cytospora paraplurivora TaxID=2898453 RepID=A0AAN9YCW4_9PEZI